MKRLVYLLCIVCFVPALGSAQSLADAARKERERQKEVQQEVKSTVTFSAEGAAATTTATTSATAAAVKPFEIKDNNGHDEKYWRKLFDQARTDLKHAEDRVQLIDNRIKNLNTAVLNRSDIYNREYRLGGEISKEQNDLENARKDVDKAKQKISDLEDELHKAGGPAGWAR